MHKQSEEDIQANKEAALKKREQFAVSLRNHKHSQVIESKRRQAMKNAFERTII